ncbi:MAG: DUF433 domain-containing protein [Treponema sp.]|nr:DUF433 domain-containing protein [Treponema sp.]
MGRIVSQIGAGETIEELLADYPYIEQEAIMQALQFAAWLAHAYHLRGLKPTGGGTRCTDSPLNSST